MTRTQAAIELLRRLKPSLPPLLVAEIDQVLAMPEGEGEKADREAMEMVEEALRMNF